MVLEQYKNTSSFMSTFKNEENMEKVGIKYMYLQHEWMY